MTIFSCITIIMIVQSNQCLISGGREFFIHEVCLPVFGAEDNVVVRGLASEGACSIIKSIAISPRAGCLEDGWVEGGLACGWVCKLPAAAVLIQSKRFAGTFACHDPTIVFHLKLFGAACGRYRGQFSKQHMVWDCLFSPVILQSICSYSDLVPL